MYVCQLCLTKSSEKFYSFNYGHPTIQEKLAVCVPKLEHDLFVFDAICNLCYRELVSAYEFQLKCLSSQTTIKNLVFGTTSNTSEGLKDLVLAIIDGNDPFDSIQENEILPFIKTEIETPDVIICDDISEENVAINEVTHKTYLCTICCRQYDKQCSLDTHLATHQIRDNKIEKRMKARKKREKLRCIHLIKTLPNNLLMQLNDESNETCETVECITCNIKLQCKHHLTYHKHFYHDFYKKTNVHFILKCNVCNLNIDHYYLKIHLSTHNICVKLFDVFKHTVTQIHYQNVLKWQCNICNSIFANSRILVNHNIKFHATRKITCNICGDKFLGKYFNIHKKYHLVSKANELKYLNC